MKTNVKCQWIVMCAFSVIGLVTLADASDIKAPFELESSQVLPRGIRNPRFKNLFMQVDSKYNGLGVVEPLGQKLNKVVSWNDIVAAQPDATQQASVEGLIKQAGIDRGGSPGSTSGQVNTYANIKVPVLAMGVTENLTIAIAVPVMKVDVSADTGFISAEDGKKFVDAAGSASGPVKADEAAVKLNDAVNQKLTRLGYERIGNMTISNIGDVKLVNKYNVIKSDWNSLSVKADVTFPTGKKPNPDRALDVPTGDGQYDVGLGAIYDRKILTQDLRWNVFGGYTMQLADTLEKRLPTSPTDSLSADKEMLRRNLGDQIVTGTSLSYTVPRIGMTFGAGYNFQYQTRTSYQGDVAANVERYRWLEDDAPLQALHSATVMTGFSTVDWYKQKKFKLPFQANLAYSHPLLGRNVTTNDVLAGELVLFF